MTGKETNAWEVTLPKKKPCWGSARPGGAKYSMPREAEESNFFQPHLAHIWSPSREECVCTCLCVTETGFRTFNCTLDLIQHTQYQATALLELTFYRAGESEAHFSPFSLRPSRAGGYSYNWQPGKGNQLPSPNWQHKPHWYPAQSARLPMALQGQASSVIKENDSKKRCKQSRFVSYFYMVSYHRRTHSRLFKPLNF